MKIILSVDNEEIKELDDLIDALKGIRNSLARLNEQEINIKVDGDGRFVESSTIIPGVETIKLSVLNDLLPELELLETYKQRRNKLAK